MGGPVGSPLTESVLRGPGVKTAMTVGRWMKVSVLYHPGCIPARRLALKGAQVHLHVAGARKRAARASEGERALANKGSGAPILLPVRGLLAVTRGRDADESCHVYSRADRIQTPGASLHLSCSSAGAAACWHRAQTARDGASAAPWLRCTVVIL
eukprot:scaffold2886_cov398-Prasinococcus_capsulatus_cf.AAC.14